MRLNAAAKLGFYPCPPRTESIISQMLTLVPGARFLRLLDPCAGEGVALRAIYQQLLDSEPSTTIETYGVEVSDVRAPIAAERLDKCICADWSTMAASHRAFSVLLLNPPYDNEHGNNGEAKQRLEYTFLRETLDQLMVDGVLVYIVPVAILANDRVRRVLAANFHGLKAYKLPEGEYEQFRQCVIFGYRRSRIEKDQGTEDLLKGYANGFLEMPVLSLAEGPVLGEHADTFEVPEAPQLHRFTFRKYHLSDEEILENVQRFGAYDNKSFMRFQQRQSLSDFSPVVPLRVGHVGSLISSGQMGVVQLGDDLMAKGFARKAMELYDADGKLISPDKHTPEELLKLVATKREKIETHVHTLTRAGAHTTINTPTVMQTFLEEHAVAIGQIIQARYKPLYIEPTEEEWTALSGLMKHKRLPGRKASGLLPAQKHVAIAAARSCKAQGWVDAVAEMGFGKSATSLATLHLMGAWPAILIAPGHLTKKWAREVKDVIPGATPIIVEHIDDMVRLHREYPKAQAKATKLIVIISKERAKLGPGWRHVTKQKKITLWDEKRGPQHLIEHRCPKCNKQLTGKEDVPLYGKLPNRRLFCQGVIKEDKEAGTKNSRGSQDSQNPVVPTQKRICGEALYESVSRHEGRPGRKPPIFGGPPITEETAATRHNDIKLRRWSIALYIKKKMKTYFGMCVADEFHQYKGKSTDQARAYHHLIDAAKYTMNLTGTIFGGKSTDLFWLRYRVDRDIREEFSFHDELRWAKEYGRLEYTINTEEENEEDGGFSGKRRHSTAAKEIPGISPLVYGRLLPSCIFARIADLGYELPEYSEHIIKLDMNLPQRLQYDWLFDTLIGHLQSLFESFEPGSNKEASKLLSVWLQNTLNRPNAAFRPDLIQWKNPLLEKFAENIRPSHLPYEVHETPDHRRRAFDLIHGPAIAVGSEEKLRFQDYDLDHTSQFLKPEEIHLLEQTYDPKAWQERIEAAEQLLKMIQSDDQPMAMPPVLNHASEVLPKEEWLIGKCLAELKHNRKCLIFVRQTGTRDIQPRLKSLLRTAGLRADILPNSLAPSAREKWIDKNMQHMDILIVNPKKVETGLDLVKFSTAIFYEIEYSLYTMWQAMRRTWRLGQTKPVKIYFPVYRDSMESGALNLMGRKMQAALMLYGDNAASAIADDVADGDFLKQLAHSALEGTLEHDGVTSLMAQDMPEEEEIIWEDVIIEAEAAPAEEEASLLNACPEPGRRGHAETEEFKRPTMFDLWDAFTTTANAVDQPIIARASKKQKVAEAQLTLF